MSLLRFIFCWLWASVALAQSISVIDSNHQTITLAHPAHRMVALAPNLVESVFEAGAGAYLVGVSSYSDYPASAKTIPVVATFYDVDIERIIALHPDIVFTWDRYLAPKLVKLAAFHIPVYFASFASTEDIAQFIQNIGKLANTETVALPAALQFQKKYASVLAHYQNRKPISVFYQLSDTPLITISRHSHIDALITACGGQNIFREAVGAAPAIDIESLLQADPEVILMSSTGRNANQWQKTWQRYPQLQAIRHHMIFRVNADVVEREGPRLWQGAKELCERIDQARKATTDV